MAIIRIHNPKNFTVINNDLINDPLLDWRDLGLLTYLLSKPDNWEVSVAHLQKIRKSSRDAIYASIKAITSAGYMTGKANPKGGFNYEVFDKPQSTPLTEYPLTDIPLTDIPLTDIPLTDIPTQVNTDTKQILKEKVNTEKAVITTPPENFENSGLRLTVEQQACFDWATTNNYWAGATTSIEEFLIVYSKPSGGMRKQFEKSKTLLKPFAAKPSSEYRYVPTSTPRELDNAIDSYAVNENTGVTHDIK